MEEGTYTSSGNTLDLILTSEEDRVLDVQVLDPLPGCDHSPVVCDVVFQFGEAWSDYHSMESRLWSRGRYNEISASLLEMDWDLAFEGLSGVEANILFLDKMYELIDKFVPLRNLKKRGMWTAPPAKS